MLNNTWKLQLFFPRGLRPPWGGLCPRSEEQQLQQSARRLRSGLGKACTEEAESLVRQRSAALNCLSIWLW